MGAPPLSKRFDHMLDDLRKKYESGIGLTELAEELEVDRKSLKNYLTKNGICVRTHVEQIRFKADQLGKHFCAKCEQYRGPEGFYKHHNITCKTCHDEGVKEWVKNNPEKVRRSQRKAAKRNAATKNAKARARRAARTEEEKVAESAWWAEYRKNYAVKDPEYGARWRAANKDLIKTYYGRRKGLKLNSKGNCTPDQVAARVAYYGSKCWICKTGKYEELDHVVALSRGGTNWAANLRPACSNCNRRKGGMEASRKLPVQEIADLPRFFGMIHKAMAENEVSRGNFSRQSGAS